MCIGFFLRCAMSRFKRTAAVATKIEWLPRFFEFALLALSDSRALMAAEAHLKSTLSIRSPALNDMLFEYAAANWCILPAKPRVQSIFFHV